MTNRIVILAAVIAIVIILCMCGVAGIVVVGRDTFLASAPETTATPTKTPKPTFTVTLTPTLTPIPTNTPIPTDTPLPTNTPIPPTPTFTLVPPTLTLPPTSTPSPVPPTNTPKPTRKPTARPRPTQKPTQKPAPTQPPKPQFAWTGQVDYSLENCALTRVYGHTLERSGALAGDVWVHYWADGWDGAWAQSEYFDKGAFAGDEHNWDGTIDNRPREGVWHVCVVPEQGGWNCVSNTVDAGTSFDCATGKQVIHITFRQN